MPAVRQLAEEAASHAGLKLEAAFTDEKPTLSPEAEQCVYRVAQEAITNVLKHAQASTLAVTLSLQNNQVILTVRDNGIGFDTSAVSGQAQFGLLGMKERVQFLNGTLVITSERGSGTTIQLTI